MPLFRKQTGSQLARARSAHMDMPATNPRDTMPPRSALGTGGTPPGSPRAMRLYRRARRLAAASAALEAALAGPPSPSPFPPNQPIPTPTSPPPVHRYPALAMRLFS